MALNPFQLIEAVRLPCQVVPVYNPVLARFSTNRIWGLLDPLVSPFWDVAKVDFWRVQVAAQPSDGDTLTIDGDVWTFRTTPSGVDPYEVEIKATNNAQRDALIEALNSNPDTLGRYYAQPIGTTYTDPDGGTQVMGVTNVTLHIFGRVPGVALGVAHTGSWPAGGFPENTVPAAAGNGRNNYRLWLYAEAEDGFHNSQQWRRLPPIQAALRPPYTQGADTRLKTELWGDLDLAGVLQLAVYPDREPAPGETLPVPYSNAIRQYRLRVGDAWDSQGQPQRRGSVEVVGTFRALYANLGDQSVGWGWGPDSDNCGLSTATAAADGEPVPYADPLAPYFPAGAEQRRWLDENATRQQVYIPGSDWWLNLWITPETWQGANAPYLRYTTQTPGGPVVTETVFPSFASCNPSPDPSGPGMFRMPLVGLGAALDEEGATCTEVTAVRPGCPDDTTTWYLEVSEIKFNAPETDPTGIGLNGTWGLQFDGGPRDYHSDEVPDLVLPQLPLETSSNYPLQEATVRQMLAFWAADLHARHPGTTASWRYGGVVDEGNHIGYIELACVPNSEAADFANAVYGAIRGANSDVLGPMAWTPTPPNYGDYPIPSNGWQATGTGPVFPGSWDSDLPITDAVTICNEALPAACDVHHFAFVNQFGAWEVIHAYGPWQQQAELERIDGTQSPDAYGPVAAPLPYSDRPAAKRGSLTRRTTLQDAYTVNSGILPIDQLANFRALFGSRKVAWLRPGGTEYLPITITNTDAVTIDDTTGTVGSVDVQFVLANPKVSQDA